MPKDCFCYSYCVAILKNINLGLRFILELCLIFTLGFIGSHASDSIFLKWLLAILLPLSASLIWGTLIAPKAAHLLDRPQRVIVELLLFGIAIALLCVTGYAMAGIVLAIAVLVNEVLLITWKQ